MGVGRIKWRLSLRETNLWTASEKLLSCSLAQHRDLDAVFKNFTIVYFTPLYSLNKASVQTLQHWAPYVTLNSSDITSQTFQSFWLGIKKSYFHIPQIHNERNTHVNRQALKRINPKGRCKWQTAVPYQWACTQVKWLEMRSGEFKQCELSNTTQATGMNVGNRRQACGDFEDNAPGCLVVITKLAHFAMLFLQNRTNHYHLWCEHLSTRYTFGF